ncbi:MAG: hypothetical protein WC676_02170 [Candidatus Omnitrophota bacterium]
MDNIKKALTFLFAIIGLLIFYTVMMVKLEVAAQQTQAHIQQLSADLNWEDFLYQNAVYTVAEERTRSKVNP